MATAAVQQRRDIDVSDLPSLPADFEIKMGNGERKYVLQICNGQPHGLYKIIAAAFDHIKATEKPDPRLLGQSNSQGYWQHKGVIENISVTSEGNPEKELERGEREVIIKNFNYIKANAIGLIDRGLSLCIVLPKM